MARKMCYNARALANYCRFAEKKSVNFTELGPRDSKKLGSKI